MSRAATSGELTLFRTAGQWSRARAAIYTPSTVYTARINQSFSTRDKILEITYDTGSGTLANVLEGMTLYIGSTAGAWDKGIARVRSIDATKIYIGETSEIAFGDNNYLTIVDSFELWARPVLISSGVVYMDGGIAYSNQHSSFLPLVRGGSNRVLRKTGATVSASFDFPATVPGSSVSSRSTSAPGSSSITGGTTQTPSISWNSVGWKLVYHTVTAANGKSFFIVRYVFVWDETNEPEPVSFRENPRGDVESGGWSINVSLYDNANLSQVRDHALIILFSEDHYGDTAQEIGPVSGAENIIFNGWIAGESIQWDSEGGSASFRAYTSHYFMQKIPTWPDGIEFTTGTPANWTRMQNLTVDLGLVHHFLMWRTTAPRIIDIFPSGDTKYAKEISSLASDLWSQISEMAFDTIFARPLCNRLGQLFLEVNPQLIPEDDRTHPTVITFLDQDLERPVELARSTMDEASIVDLSGVKINSNGRAVAYFSLSPGHSHSQYGSPIVQNRLLLSSQAQANQLAGLYRGWVNNPYGPILLKPSANNRLIDIAPLQKCDLGIASGDTIRGVSESLGLVPLSVEDVFEADSGYYRQEITFEAETFEDLSVKGEVPGSENVEYPPPPPLPPIEPFEPIIPTVVNPPEEEEGTVARVLVHDTTYGLGYSENFDETSPNWETVNAGLSQSQYQEINYISLSPSGEIYVAHLGFGTPFIAYAPSIGAEFTVIEDATSIAAKFPGSTSQGANAIGVNPFTGEAAYVITSGAAGVITSKFYIGSGLSFAEGVDLSSQFHPNSRGTLSYGNDAWRLTGMQTNTTSVRFVAISPDGSSIIRNVTIGGTFAINLVSFHTPISTSDVVYMFRDNGIIKITQNGAVSGDFTTIIGTGLNYVDFWDAHTATDPTGTYIMSTWDTGDRGRSSDGGATFVGIPNLPFGSDYSYAYAGGSGLASKWIAARGIIRMSEDFGDTWIEKAGTINLIIPILSIDIVKVVP